MDQEDSQDQSGRAALLFKKYFTGEGFATAYLRALPIEQGDSGSLFASGLIDTLPGGEEEGINLKRDEKRL